MIRFRAGNAPRPGTAARRELGDRPRRDGEIRGSRRRALRAGRRRPARRPSTAIVSPPAGERPAVGRRVDAQRHPADHHQPGRRPAAGPSSSATRSPYGARAGASRRSSPPAPASSPPTACATAAAEAARRAHRRPGRREPRRVARFATGEAPDRPARRCAHSGPRRRSASASRHVRRRTPDRVAVEVGDRAREPEDPVVAPAAEPEAGVPVRQQAVAASSSRHDRAARPGSCSALQRPAPSRCSWRSRAAIDAIADGSPSPRPATSIMLRALGRSTEIAMSIRSASAPLSLAR